MPKRRPPSHAGRQRRYLERLLAGKVLVSIELDPAETAKLYDFEYIDDPGKVYDKHALAHAIHQLIALVQK
jgi:hypothetical protein